MIKFKEFLLSEIAPIKRGHPKSVVNTTWDGKEVGPTAPLKGYNTYDYNDYIITNHGHHETNILKPGAKPVTEPESKALRGYTNIDYMDLNKFLNKSDQELNSITKAQAMSTDRGQKRKDDQIKRISSALSKHNTVHDMYVYRGFDLGGNLGSGSRSALLNLTGPSPKGVPHRVLHSRGFMSTTTNLMKAKDTFSSRVTNERNKRAYSNILKIHVPAGSHGMFMKDYSVHDTEREFLLHHGSKVAIHPKPTVDQSKCLVVWHGNLVHDGIQPTRHAIGKKDVGYQEKLFKKKEVPMKVPDIDHFANRKSYVPDTSGKEDFIQKRFDRM